MDDTTKTMVITIAAGIIKKGLIAGGALLAGHGFANGFTGAEYAGAAVAIAAAGYSLWNDYGKAIVISQLEVLKAKSLAQAAKMKEAGVKPVTVTEIAAQSPTMTAATVTKTIASLPLPTTVAEAAARQK